MEYHSYDSLFKAIQLQYPSSKTSGRSESKEDAILGSLVDAYRVPTTGNLLKAFNTATTPQEKPIEMDNIDSYIYVHRSN